MLVRLDGRSQLKRLLRSRPPLWPAAPARSLKLSRSKTSEKVRGSFLASEAREELASQFSSEYILIGSSFAVTSTNTTTSPSLNEEVGEGVTPKIVRETKYVVYAVKKSEVNDFITAKLNAKIGDNTQMIYSTGVAMQEGEEDKAFFESYKNDNGNMSAKLKSTTKTGPRITEDMVKEVSLGEKVGKVQSNLRSYNGVSEAYVETSYFWVMRVPDDDNKVQIEITVE